MVDVKGSHVIETFFNICKIHHPQAQQQNKPPSSWIVVYCRKLTSITTDPELGFVEGYDRKAGPQRGIKVWGTKHIFDGARFFFIFYF